MKFFIDNNLPPIWGEGLSSLSRNKFADGQSVDSVIHLVSRFNSSAPDMHWIKELGSENDWVIISLDKFKKAKGVERKLLGKYNLPVFVLQSSWSNFPFWKKTAQLINWWPEMVFRASSKDHFVLEVPWILNKPFKDL